MASLPSSPLRSRGEIALGFLQLWLLFTAFCTLAGWLLSAFHALTAWGWWGLAILFGFGASRLQGIRAIGALFAPGVLPALRRRRFARVLPCLFLLLAVAITARGLVNPGLNPNDALSYRLPRVLHWLAEGGWHWIATIDPRMNTRGTGYEWMTVPFLLSSRSENGICLLSAISFWLLPTTIFLTFRELGVRARVTRFWAWVLPASFFYLLQAGTLSTDGLAVIYSLSAVGLALRAKRLGSAELAFYSVLAAALLTNQKASNLPLLLPFLLAWCPNWRLACSRPKTFATVLLLGFAVSFGPMAASNLWHLGSITGLNAEADIYKPGVWWATLPVNTVLVLGNLLLPPIVSVGGGGPNLFDLFHSPALSRYLVENFETTYGVLPGNINQTATSAGLGIVILLLASLGWRPAAERPWSHVGWVRRSAWVACTCLILKSTLLGLPRILSPYYLLLVPSLLLSARAGRLVRSRRWLGFAALNSAASLLILVGTTDTPLWPIRALYPLEAKANLPAALRRLCASYDSGLRVQDFYRSIGEELPATERVIGLVRHWGEPELALWKPFGRHLIAHVLPSEEIPALRSRGIRHVILAQFAGPTGGFLARWPGAVIEREWSFAHTRVAPIHVLLLKLPESTEK